MDNPLVSIIVPIYNAEKYLGRCLDSIINQTYQNIEIILVDDGSQDSSGQICDKYITKDSRIIVIHKENGGVASARQTGLDTAKGVFVIHVDPDDWIEVNMIQEMVNKALRDNVDIVMCDFLREYKIGPSLFIQKPTSIKRDDLLRDLLYDRIWGSCCNKLIKKSVFEKYNVSFVPDMSLWEDLYVVTLLIYYGATVSYISAPLYHYDCFSNSDSITRAPKISHIYSVKTYIDYFEKLLHDSSFLDGFVMRKIRLKALCFRMGKEYKSVFDFLFPEVDHIIIRDYKFRWKDIRIYRGDLYKMERVCMAMNVKWHTAFGYYLYDFWKKYATKSFRSLFK